MNTYVLALASLIMVGGTLGDRYGRRRLYLVGLALFTLFSVACALARDDPQLIAARALQGVGAAIMAPLTLSILVDAFPPERRTTAIGIWALVAGLGFGSGPILGGLLIRYFDRSAIFWVNVPLGVLCFALTLAAVRESREPAARPPDPLGALLVSGGLLVLTYALVGSNEHPWTSPRTVGLLAAASGRARGLRRLGAAGGASHGAALPFLLVSPFAGRLVSRFGSAAVSAPACSSALSPCSAWRPASARAS